MTIAVTVAPSLLFASILTRAIQSQAIHPSNPTIQSNPSNPSIACRAELERMAAISNQSPPQYCEGTPHGAIPIELQLEEVDMNNEDMDILEWAVRKLLPIPKKYFWETGNYDLPLKTKVWHRSVGFLGSVLRVTERIGKPFVNATGLTSSRFDYVTSTMTDEQWDDSKQIARERGAQRAHLAPTRRQDGKEDLV